LLKPENGVRLRLFGACGILVPLVAFSCILSAVASYPQFSWFDNALSDLGVVSGATGLIFNFGLIASGILCIVFVIGLFIFLGKSVLGRVGAFVLFLTCLALVGIGVFPESFGETHYFVSVMFFVLLPVSLLIIVAAFLWSKEVLMGMLTLFTAIAAAIPWVLLFSVHYVSGVAIPETISALAGSVWTIMLGYKMFKEESRQLD
jgi:hypothetical membrane protein